MASFLKTVQWIEILQEKKLTTELDIAIFQTLYSSEGHSACASQIGRILGYGGNRPHAPMNFEVGRYAKRIAHYYDINFTERSKNKFKYWDLFFNGQNEGKFFVWELRKEIVEALEETDLTGDQLFAEEIPVGNKEKLIEGAMRTIVVNAYERNSQARKRCIEHYGTICMVCGFDFEKTYGELGNDFIHVHHLTPLSDIRGNYEVNPITDMRPVCPNCHAMLHRKEPALTIKKLKSLLP